MQDPYEVLGVEPKARQEEIEAAFQELVETRKASRRSTADLHAAYAVLSDATLRKAWDFAEFGRATSVKVAQTKEQAIELAKDAIPEIDWAEVGQNAWQTSLKLTVLVSGVAARVADATGHGARRLQVLAASRIQRTE